MYDCLRVVSAVVGGGGGNALKRCSSFMGFENLFGVAAANVYVHTSKCEITYCDENADKKLSSTF